MNKQDCRIIQRELDEMLLTEDCRVEVSRHLTECSDCSDFHLKQTKLRQIVGSLGTVPAPADFDFRLRSRLANENTSSNFHLGRSVWSFGQRTAAAATAFILLVGVVILVQNLPKRNATTNNVAEKESPKNLEPPPSSIKLPTEQARTPDVKTTASIVVAGNPRNKRIISNGPRSQRPIAVADFGSERAPLVRDQKQLEAAEAIFPIDASKQSLKVSLFDARGNPRTISLPTVSFGSQRVVPTTTSFAPKGVW